LLYRFYDVTGGAITFEGIDIRKLRLADLRRASRSFRWNPRCSAYAPRQHCVWLWREAPADAGRDRGGREDAYAHDFITGFRRLRHKIGERGTKPGGRKARRSRGRSREPAC
jgi:hypothetical protein